MLPLSPPGRSQSDVARSAGLLEPPTPAATTVTSAARRRDDAAPTEYASSLVFATRRRSPSGHLDGRGRRLGARSRPGYVQPENLRDRTHGARHDGPWRQSRACAVRGSGALVA